MMNTLIVNARTAVIMHLFLSLLYVVQPFSITSDVIIGMKRKALMRFRGCI